MVSPSCIPYSTIEMPDIEMSPDEVFDKVLKDSDDEPIVKIKVSDSWIHLPRILILQV